MKLIKLWEADLDRTYALQNSFPKEKNGFINEACGLSREEFKEYVQRREANSRGLQLPDGFVPSTVYILENEDGEYVGIFNFRHCLNDFLRNGPGHIGYGIGPKYRGRGYATEGLRLMLQIAEKEISEDEIFLSVHKDNPASLKVQLKNGAYIHGETETEYLTRIPRSREHRSMGT
ncbi:MAG TPA: GNAT family N-acetyltransferase [Candidatus Eisenbergiella pullistercoris]|uniref:GNAT family N-acetyltransferase n=1 Tax=Candidatus Eisenbergiella pullistercoris TaxID=2838555 RepID=A0A9D1YN06_9FIRM|nr:GNAT family N-acetyltransferase [Candidatus Eisenbergiella pullistercoris]